MIQFELNCLNFVVFCLTGVFMVNAAPLILQLRNRILNEYPIIEIA